MVSLRVVPSVLALASAMGVTYFGGWVLTRTYPLFEPLIAWHHKKYVGPIHPDSLGLSLDFTFIISCFVTGAFLGGIVASVISRHRAFCSPSWSPLRRCWARRHGFSRVME